MFNDIPLETLVFTRQRIVTELKAGIADDSVRSQYERVGIVLDTRIAQLGGVVVAIGEELPQPPIQEITLQEDGVDDERESHRLAADRIRGYANRNKHPQLTLREAAMRRLELKATEDPEVQEMPTVMGPSLPDKPTTSESTATEEPIVLNPLVESGRTWVDFAKRSRGGRRILSPDELELLQLKQAIRNARRTDMPIIVRFDPELGVYNRSGKMYADATESPVIKRNLQAVVEVCSLLAHLSHVGMQRGMVFTTDELLHDLDMSDIDTGSRRALFHEVKRLLSPSRVITLTNNLEEGSSVSILQEFTFVMTELVAREGKQRKSGNKDTATIDVGFVGMQDGDCDTESIRNMMLAKKVPRPNTHKQAVALLDALMHDAADFFDMLESKTGTEHAQTVKDIAHIFIQQQLGWNAYFVARLGRMIRSGNQGFTGVVRQVTGSQQNERFQHEAHAEPDTKNE